MIPAPDKSSGFTLIEVVIAMFIGAFIVVAAYLALDGAQSQQRQVDTVANRLKAIQFAVNSLEQDLEYLSPRPVRDGFGDRVPLLRGKSDDADSYLELTRGQWRNPANLPRSNLQHLRYYLEDGTLMREHWLFVDRADDSEGVRRELLTGVEELEVEFYDGERWLDNWLAESVLERDTADMPRAVRITLHLDSEGAIIRTVPVFGGHFAK